MGIRFEKDTILNWVNDMAKYLRLVVDHYEHFDKEKEILDIEKGYTEYFKKERSFFQSSDTSEIDKFISSLEPEQLRPLAQLLMYDGLIHKDKALLKNARYIFEWNMNKTNSFSFDDYGFLAMIDKEL
jgi:hypothetical protein